MNFNGSTIEEYSEEMLTTSVKMRILAALVPPNLFPWTTAIIDKGISTRE